MKSGFISVFCMFFIYITYAQTPNRDIRNDCIRALQQAEEDFADRTTQTANKKFKELYQKLYDSGCLSQLNKELEWRYKVRMYEMLIILNEERSVEVSIDEKKKTKIGLFRDLLEIFPEYQARADTNKIKLLGNYGFENLINRSSRLSIGFQAGISLSMAQVLRPYEVDIDNGNSSENYLVTSKNTRPMFGLQVNYPLLFKKYANHWYSPFELGAELLYSEQAVSYQRDLAFSTSLPEPNFTDLSFVEAHKRVSVPILLRWRKSIGEKDPNQARLFFSIHGGFALSYLFDAKLKNLVRSNVQTLPGSPNVGVQNLKDVNIGDQRRNINYSWIAGLGLRYKIASGTTKRSIGFLSLDLRYEYQMKNQVINRFDNQELNYLYGYGQSDFGLRHLSILLGYTYTFFNPKEIKSNE